MSEHNKPRGILRNKSLSNTSVPQSSEPLDRQKVIENTRLNAQAPEETSEGDKIRAQLAERKGSNDESAKSNEHLKWDELNLYESEQAKSATMKIDEPKTPYEGGFDPNNEYYRDDDEEIPSFELGEGENDDTGVVESLGGAEVVRDENQDEHEEEEERPLSAEEKHRRFEEMRKSHYHMKGEALKHNIANEPDADE